MYMYFWKTSLTLQLNLLQLNFISLFLPVYDNVLDLVNSTVFLYLKDAQQLNFAS